MAEITLPQLLTKRGPLKARVTRIVTWLNDFTVENDDDYCLLLTKEEGLISVFNSFNSLYEQINNFPEAEEEFNYFLEVEETYYQCKSKITALKRSHKQTYDPLPQSTQVVQTSSHQDSMIYTRLPDLTLPKFDGNFTGWLEFRDTFQSVIVSSSRLSNIDKFHYLKGCLSPEAYLTISNIPISNDNFDIAWRTLCERYDNVRLIANNHIDKLFYPPNLEKNDPSSLQKFLDHFVSNCNALNQLHLNIPLSDLVISKLILDKLPPYYIREWETQINHNEIPNLQELLDFIKSRVTIAEMTHNAIRTSSNNKTKSSDTKSNDKHVTKNNNHSNQGTSRQNNSFSSQSKCKCCNQTGHVELFNCLEFRNWSVHRRQRFVNENKCCTICLRFVGHSSYCQNYSCKICKGKHSSLLHRDPPQSQDTAQNISGHVTSNHLNGKSHLLPTATVRVTQANGRTITANALLDCGSDCSLITQRFFDKLRIKSSSQTKRLSGILSSNVSAHKVASLQILSNTSDWTTEIEALIVPSISDSRLPSSYIQTDDWKIPPNILLADNRFNQPKDIDLLLGVEVIAKIGCSGTLTAPHLPTLQNSQLGWYVFGTLSSPVNDNQMSLAVSQNSTNYSQMSAFISSQTSLNEQLSKFWELEGVNNSPPYKEESFCESHYVQTTTRDPSGRYIVKLPFKLNAKPLGNSKAQATKRLFSLEKRLASSDKLKTEYHNFMKEYLDLGHMELTQNPSINDYFIPHHAVFKPSSSSTPIRIVFDASAITSNGNSLNDLLENGPVIQPDLFSILIQFRQNSIAITSDISKMYRQILIHPSQRHLQRILWRDNIEEPIKVYSLKTVTYGTTPASFLAVRSLKQLTLDEGKDYPLACKVINNNMYIDDLICSVPTNEEAIQLASELNELMPKGGFQLRKWSSNSSQVLESLEPSLIEKLQSRTFGDKDCSAIKALGLIWEPNTDLLRIEVASLDKFPKYKCTKRNLLSCIASIFDPIGLISPIVSRCKFIFQMLWKTNLNWDQPIPSDIAEMWFSVYSELHLISNITIPRHASIDGKITSFQLHGFCDASEKGYGACFYLRTVNEQNQIKVALLCSKGKVAPTKIMTIPRLELLAAHLLSILYNKIYSNFASVKPLTFLWSDSNIVLAWIKHSPATLKTFVANRVADVQEFTEGCQWGHVGSNDNPADLLSRGSSPKELLENKIWWNGPPWLTSETERWKENIKTTPILSVPERRVTFHIQVNDEFITNVTCKFSYLKTIRVMSYILRFIHNVKNASELDFVPLSGPISPSEFNNALKTCVRLIQSSSFHQEIQSLSNHKELSSKSSLHAFNPFIDNYNILRVGGRLQNANITEDEKHQMLLPSKHPFVKQLIIYTHRLLCHAGTQLIISHLRKTFWIISARLTIRSILRKCNTCFRYNAAPLSQLMGNLPPNRVLPTHPFVKVSIDYAGPFLIKYGSTRSKVTTKSYLSLFICSVTKALHLELVTELTTKAFLAAFSRFTSRRGLPSDVYTDNGTNFVGASKELKNDFKMFLSTQHEHELQNITCHLGIKWHFLPPHAPHMGGLHEAAVKSVKHHLKRMTQDLTFTYEELSTLLIRIESILNSRPLLALNEDPDDLSLLTPAHFLIGRSMNSIPSLITENLSLRTRWCNSKNIIKLLWDKWSKEYLQSLQRRSKWTATSPNLKVGTVVLVIEDNTHPLSWITAIIHETHPGKDGLVRVATIKTPTGLYKRPITKLCPLPSCQEEV